MRIGVLGGGQLGRMLALAGHPLGLSFVFLDPNPDAPMHAVAKGIVAGYDDPKALDELASAVDLVTFEFENVPADVAHHLESHVRVFPPPIALETAQERLAEKSLFRSLGIPTPEFAPADDRAGFDRAIGTIGFPCVIKTRRDGYDGKGQAVARDAAEAEAAWNELGGKPLIVEAFVRFRREVSILGIRSAGGEERFYPLVENHHASGILVLSRAPAANVTPELQRIAEDYARRSLEELDYTGVVGLELFETDEGLLANEMAPRVHNSGHWTIEGAVTSQFENHLRAGLSWPLGSTACVGHSAMVNLIGTVPPVEALLAVPGAHVHLYDKSPAPMRKLGHVTLRSDTAAGVDAAQARLESIVVPVSSPAESLS